MTIFGALGLPETDYQFINTIGQAIVYDALLQVLGDHNADMQRAERVFVERTTDDFKFRYKLPGSGELQRVGRQSRPADVKASGTWDVSMTLEEHAASIARDRVSMGYMNMQEFNRHVETVKRQDRNTVRKEMLRALLNNAQRTFADEVRGDLTIVPLANGDAVKYPPIIGSIDDATAQHYITSGFAAGSISDANNPIPILVNTLEQHFGTPTGGSNIVVFLNNAQTTAFQNLSNFDPVPNRFVHYGLNVSLVDEESISGEDQYDSPLPGRIIGETDSALLSEWRWFPAGYLGAFQLDAEKPLFKRIDPAGTGLGNGELMLVSEDGADLSMTQYPFRESIWSHRFGFGVGNRLNGVIMQLTTGGSYTAPAPYNF